MKLSNMKMGIAALWLANLTGPLAHSNPTDSIGMKLLSLGIALAFGLLAVLNLVEAVELRAKERQEKDDAKV